MALTLKDLRANAAATRNRDGSRGNAAGTSAIDSAEIRRAVRGRGEPSLPDYHEWETPEGREAAIRRAKGRTAPGLTTVPFVRGSKPVSVTIPGLRVESNPNKREYWTVARLRKDAQRLGIKVAFLEVILPAPPVVVRMVRLYDPTLKGGRKGLPGKGKRIDDDNCTAGFKAIRDQIAEFYGIDDARADLVRYETDQEPGPTGVRIEIRPLRPAARKDGPDA